MEILVIDDDARVRNFFVQALRRLGYSVLEAGSATEALEISAAFPGVIDLFILDYGVDEATQPRLAHRLRTNRPAAKLLYTSGYSVDVVRRYDPSIHPNGFLQKPFTLQTLADAVTRMMEI